MCCAPSFVSNSAQGRMFIASREDSQHVTALWEDFTNKSGFRDGASV
jgi:hypothetical protein